MRPVLYSLKTLHKQNPGKALLYQDALIEVRKAHGLWGRIRVCAHPEGGHIGPPLQKIYYLYDSSLVLVRPDKPVNNESPYRLDSIPS